jgi:hypothetical protein
MSKTSRFGFVRKSNIRPRVPALQAVATSNDSFEGIPPDRADVIEK